MYIMAGCGVRAGGVFANIVARVRVRETGAAAPGARTAAPGFPASPAWVRQAVYLDNSGFTS